MAHEDLMRSPISPRIDGGKRATLTIYIPEHTFNVMEEYKNERGMFLSRFVSQVIKAYMSDENIVRSVMYNPEMNNIYKTIPKTFMLSGETLDFVRTMKNLTGVPQSKLVANCLTHAIEELQAGVPFGSTVDTDPTRWGKSTKAPVDKLDVDVRRHG